MMEEVYTVKNFVGKNTKIIEIVSGDSQLGVLKRMDNDNIKCILPLQFAFGDLKEINKYNRTSLKKLYDEQFLDEYNFENEINTLKEYISKCEKIRVWSSHLDTDEYLLLLYICYLFPDKNISVVFSEEFNWYCLSIGMMNPEEVKELEKREHILRKVEIDDYCRQWKEVIKENSELRHIENGVIKNISIDYFDEQILKILKDLGEVNIYRLIANLMINKVIDNSGDSLYMYLINRLIKLDKIKVLKVVDGKQIIAVNGS